MAVRHVQFRYILRAATNFLEARFVDMGPPVVELEKVLEWVKDQLILKADGDSLPIERLEALKMLIEGILLDPGKSDRPSPHPHSPNRIWLH